MRPYTGFGAIIAGLAVMAGPASAQEAKLTPVEQETVTQACEIGLPLVPVESDYGYETGEYALPLQQSDGEVHSALILRRAQLQDIPECRGLVEDQVAEQRDRSDNNIS